MTQQRGTITDRLSNVIQVIQLGRKSGVLSVERGEGARLDIGELTFMQGQITEARADDLIGQPAIAWLVTWGACRFWFLELAPDKVTRLLPAVVPDPYSQRDAINGSQFNARDDATARPEYDITGSRLHFRRTMDVADALSILEQSGLSRVHRRVYLLIDGQRTLEELSRLVGRGIGDVMQILYDLERSGVLAQS